MSYDSPAVILYDGYGNPVLIDGYHISVYPKGIGIGGHFPDPSLDYPIVSAGEKSPFLIDEHGGIATRSQVFTDEGSYYFDFNSALSSDWTTDTNGSSVLVSASNLIIILGTGSDGYATLTHPGHTLPTIMEFELRIFGRKSSQTTRVGFTNMHGGFAYLEYTSPATDLATFSTSCTGAVGTVQSTDFSIPNKLRTSSNLKVRIEMGFGYAACVVDGKKVALHERHMPEVYNTLNIYIDIRNLDNQTSNTYLYMDSIRLLNHNVVQIAGNYTSLPINVNIEDNTNIVLKGPKADDASINVEREGTDNIRLFTSDAEAVNTLNEITLVLKRIEKHLAEMNEFDVDTGDIDE